MQQLFIIEENGKYVRTYKVKDLVINTVGLNVIFSFYDVVEKEHIGKCISLTTDCFNIIPIE